MKRLRFNQIIMIILIMMFFIFFVLQQLIFHDIKQSGFLFFQDLLFLPLEILLVTFILDKIIQSREKQKKIDHMNIVISAFFSELGIDVLKVLNNTFILDFEDMQNLLNMNADWKNSDFEIVAKKIRSYTLQTKSNADSLEEIKTLLHDKKNYLLQLFSNPNLLEHDTFTDMLWALYHLIDELENRDVLYGLPKSDMDHLSGDMERAYNYLVYEWIYYMKHLKIRYPYLWSLAVRKNPFVENSSIIIK